MNEAIEKTFAFFNSLFIYKHYLRYRGN